MIRPTTLEDCDALIAMTAATGLFRDNELEALGEVLADYFAANHEYGHVCVTDEADGAVRGFAYYAPAAMTDRTWYLYWIVVDPEIQGKGIGGALLKHSEDELRATGQRVLLVETSSLESYRRTRQFYVKGGYDEEARLRGYYKAGDDMVVYRKELNPE